MMILSMDDIKLLADQAADPPKAVPWKRRKVISMPQIMEEGTDVPSPVFDRE